MRFRRMTSTTGILALVMVCMAFASGAHATPLTPFIDLQEKGLTLVGDGGGLFGWGGGPHALNANVGGPVRFALLYWQGRERPCVETPAGSGDCSGVAQPFKDQQMTFDGNPITGTIIGTETQPISGGGPILNIGYFADVTSIVSARGAGNHTFQFSDGNNASNLWRVDGVSLIIGYTNPADTAWYRVMIFDGTDLAYGNDPTPGDNRSAAAISFNHGANLSNRGAELLLVVGDCEENRPERIDISNNASLVSQLTGANGTEWDHMTTPISIPAGIGSTDVQLFSEPPGQANPDSLIWVAAALRVQQLDAAKPRCPITLNDPGPPARIEVTAWDAGTGLAEILVTRSENADTVVPPFTVGTNDPVVITATKIDQTQKARVETRITDLAGNVAICDPILLLAIRDQHNADEAAIPGVPRAEDKVTITNGTPGVATFEITVNGKKFKTSGLKDGEERTLDISSAMVPGDNNTVQVKVTGKPGGSANVMIWDGITN